MDSTTSDHTEIRQFLREANAMLGAARFPHESELNDSPSSGETELPTGLSPADASPEHQQIREYVEDTLAIVVSEEKLYLLEGRLRPLMDELGCDSFDELVRRAKSDARLHHRVTDAITINETSWFRDSHPFEIFRQILLPQYAAEIQDGTRQQIRVWSAACSTGQEPYSLALTFLEDLGRFPWLAPEVLEIVATDVSPDALSEAAAGFYDEVAISRGLPEQLRDRWFGRTPGGWQISGAAQARVEFATFNLKDPLESLGSFDIVLCRNVAIYFSTEFKVDLFARIAQRLSPDGTLILGATEALAGLSTEYERRTSDRGLYYKRRT